MIDSRKATEITWACCVVENESIQLAIVLMWFKIKLNCFWCFYIKIKEKTTNYSKNKVCRNFMKTGHNGWIDSKSDSY